MGLTQGHSLSSQNLRGWGGGCQDACDEMLGWPPSFSSRERKELDAVMGTSNCKGCRQVLLWGNGKTSIWLVSIFTWHTAFGVLAFTFITSVIISSVTITPTASQGEFDHVIFEFFPCIHSFLDGEEEGYLLYLASVEL